MVTARIANWGGARGVFDLPAVSESRGGHSLQLVEQSVPPLRKFFRGTAGGEVGLPGQPGLMVRPSRMVDLAKWKMVIKSLTGRIEALSLFQSVSHDELRVVECTGTVDRVLNQLEMKVDTELMRVRQIQSCSTLL